MMKRKVQLYVNSTKAEAEKLSQLINKELIAQGYEVVEDNADIVIGLGGDGTLLHFLKENNYKTSACYIGVNCGTLGFLQDFNVADVRGFVKNIPLYVKQHLRFVVIEIEVSGIKYTFKALNEFVIQDLHDKTFRSELSVGDELLENFVGSGFIFSTPTGSTALNLSAGGCILHPDLEAIQITPREAIANSKIHCLSKSICVPKGLDIILKPNSNDYIKVYSDGQKLHAGPYEKIRIYYSDEGMLKLKDRKDSFIKTIREKLI